MEGTIERIVAESGAIERCPECNRVLVNDHCVVHLDVDPKKDMRVKAQLGDGTTVVFDAKKVEHLLGLSTEDIHALPEHDAANLVQNKFKDQSVTVTVNPINEKERIYRVTKIHAFG